MSTVSSTFEDFFLTLPGTADDVGGFRTLKGALMNVREALDTTKPAGAELQRVVVNAFSSITDSIFGSLSGPDGLKNVERIVRQTAVAFEDLKDVVEIGLGGAGAMVTSFLRGIGLMNSEADDLFSGPMSKEKLEEQKLAFKEFGTTVGEALAGVTHALKMVGDAWGIVAPFFDFFVDHPAVMQAVLKAVPGGGLAAEALSSLTDKTVDRMVKDRSDMSKTPGGGAAQRYLPPISVTVNSSHADPAAVGAASQNGVRAALQEYMDSTHRIASQAGEL